MTNADVPLLAMDGIFSNPQNPFTGNPLVAEKQNGIDVFTDELIGMFPGNEVLPAGTEVWHVKDNIFREENWSHIEAP